MGKEGEERWNCGWRNRSDEWRHRLGLAVDACLCGIVLSQSGDTLLIMVVVVGFVDQEVVMDNSGFFFLSLGGSMMMCDGCGFGWFDTLIMTTGFPVWLRDLGFLVGMKFSGGLMINAGEVFKANKVGLVAFLLYRNWTQFRLRHRTKLTQEL